MTWQSTKTTIYSRRNNFNGWRMASSNSASVVCLVVRTLGHIQRSTLTVAFALHKMDEMTASTSMPLSLQQKCQKVFVYVCVWVADEVHRENV